MTNLREVRNLFPVDGIKTRLKIFTEAEISNQYIRWLNDPEVVKYSKQRFLNTTKKTATQYLQSFQDSPNIFLAIFLKDNHSHIGTMTINFSDDLSVPEIRILIGDKDYWGKGVGLDAWSTVLTLLLENAGFEKVIGGALDCNTGMLKIMGATGMTLEKIVEKYDVVDDVSSNALIFSKKNFSKI